MRGGGGWSGVGVEIQNLEIVDCRGGGIHNTCRIQGASRIGGGQRGVGHR